jgi:hypothetical protein
MSDERKLMRGEISIWNYNYYIPYKFSLILNFDRQIFNRFYGFDML